jgi:hypothetical protein
MAGIQVRVKGRSAFWSSFILDNSDDLSNPPYIRVNTLLASDAAFLRRKSLHRLCPRGFDPARSAAIVLAGKIIAAGANITLWQCERVFASLSYANVA